MSEPGTPSPETTSLWRNRSFLRYWIASQVSSLGSQLSLIAYPLLVLSLGMGAARAGIVSTCSMVARLALQLLGGQLADRYNRRRLMLAGDLVRMVALGSIPAAAGFGHLTFAQLLVVAVIEGAATALFFGPASSIAFRDVVPEERMGEAISRFEASQGAVMLLGPALGGALYAIDRIIPFTVDAASYALSAVMLLALPRPAQKARDESEQSRSEHGLGAGLSWLARNPQVLRALFFCLVLNLAGAAAEIAVVVNLRLDGVASAVIGLVMACAGVGAILGSLGGSTVIRKTPNGVPYLLVGVVWTIGFLGLALQPPAWVVGPLLVCIVGTVPMASIVLGTTLMNDPPRELTGRVSAAANTLTAGLSAFGPMIAGIAISGFGARTAWVSFAAVAGLATVALALPLVLLASRGGRADHPGAAPDSSTQEAIEA